MYLPRMQRWPSARRTGCRWTLAGAVLAVVAFAPLSAAAQRPETDVISSGHFRGLSLLHAGEYDLALNAFNDAGRGAMRVGDARWIDSIAYHAMTGEIYYQTGKPGQALDHFNSALRLYVQLSDWMLRVQFPPRLTPRTTVMAQVPWGTSQRRFRLAQVPDKFNIDRGRLVVGRTTGGTAVQQQGFLVPLHVSELVRCTALAMHRRQELLGPIAQHDRLTQEVLAKASARSGPPNHWSEVWTDLQYGIALKAAGRKDQAVTALQRAIVAGGEFDHPLTCVAMLELGRIAMDKGDFKSAGVWLLEASYSAFYFSRLDVVEEALRLGAQAHLLGGGKGIYPPLAAAAEWGQSHRARTLQATLALAAVENFVALGDSRQASTAMALATRAINRKELDQSALGARFNYVTAILGYQRRMSKVADPALAAALKFQKQGSVRLFQIKMVDQYYREGAIRDRLALEMFARVLGDPTASDWLKDPLDALATLLVAQDTYLERWLEAAIQRDDLKVAVEVTDRIRRRRFYGTLPMGGRLLSLRWLLDAPHGALPEAAVLQRSDLVGRYPQLKESRRQTEKILTELKRLPPLADGREEVAAQNRLWNDLVRASSNQEEVLNEIALRREPAEMAFPPQLPTAEIQERLRDGQAVLSFLAGRRETYAFLITPDRIGGWKIASPDGVKKRLVALLRSLGNFDQNRDLEAAQLKDPSWRGDAAELLKEIMAQSKIDLGIGIKELVVVPDGIFWYLPFEVLQIGKTSQTEMLLSRMRVRYAPTVGLAVPDAAARRQGGALAVVMGRVYPHEPDELSQKALARLRRVGPQVVGIQRLPTVPSSLVAKRFDALVVLDDLTSADEANPYQLRPMRLDRSRPGGALEDWFTMPLGGPEIVALPGFHTPAESALKKLNKTSQPGEELFLTTCALMSTGAKTVLISRWRNGGQTGNELIAELIQELPTTSAADAWQRAVEVARQSPLDVALEPRIKESKDVENLTGEHPFLWGGYMLVDTGVDPRPAPPKKSDTRQPAAP